jgi:hypothetical protein
MTADSNPDADEGDAPAVRAMRPTPSSAPVVAFLNATQDSSTVTEVAASPPFRRAPLIVTAIVVIALAVGVVAYLVR